MTSKRSKHIELNLFVFTCVKCLHGNYTLNALSVWTSLCFSPRAVWSIVARSSERQWLKENRAKCRRGSFRHYLCWPQLNGTMCYPTCAPTCSASSVIYTLPAALSCLVNGNWYAVLHTCMVLFTFSLAKCDYELVRKLFIKAQLASFYFSCYDFPKWSLKSLQSLFKTS